MFLYFIQPTIYRLILNLGKEIIKGVSGKYNDSFESWYFNIDS
jgi:hypothetical protein